MRQHLDQWTVKILILSYLSINLLRFISKTIFTIINWSNMVWCYLVHSLYFSSYYLTLPVFHQKLRFEVVAFREPISLSEAIFKCLLNLSYTFVVIYRHNSFQSINDLNSILNLNFSTELCPNPSQHSLQSESLSTRTDGTYKVHQC